MAFPVIADTNTSSEAIITSSHTVSLPANISSGDLLIVFFSVDSDDENPGWPGGWTGLIDIDGPANTLAVGYRVADGNEGATITVTTDTEQQSAHISYRITGHDSSSNPPEVSTGATSLAGGTANPDPDALTPTGGSKEYLWIAVEGNDNDDATTVYPTNYTLSQLSKISSAATGACHISTAGRNLEAASEDPGAFTIAAIEQWAACTVAVYPTAIVTGWIMKPGKMICRSK